MEKASIGFRKGETWVFAFRAQNYCRSLNSFYWGFNWFSHWHQFSDISSSCLIKDDLWNTPKQKWTVYRRVAKYSSFTRYHHVTHGQFFGLPKALGGYKITNDGCLRSKSISILWFHEWVRAIHSFDSSILSIYWASHTCLGKSK